MSHHRARPSGISPRQRASTKSAMAVRRGAVAAGRDALLSGMAGHPSAVRAGRFASPRSEEHTSELQSLMRISYAVFCLKKKTRTNNKTSNRVIVLQDTKTWSRQQN